MRTRRVRNGAVELHVVEAGDAKKPAILFLHGFPDCHRVWEHQFNALAADFHVIAFDMRGCGRSSPLSGGSAYRIENILPDIAAVIDATCGRDGKVHLVGHDWGSCLGWSFVCDPRHAQRVLSYTSMSGPHVGLLWQWLGRKLSSGSLADARSALEQFAHSWYIFALNVPGAGRTLFRLAGVEVWKRGLRQGGVPEQDPYLDVGQDDVERMVLGPISLYQENAFRPPEAPAPGSVRLPVQLLVPRDDLFIRPQIFEFLGEVCSNLVRTEIGANHWAQRSHPALVTGAIRNFVQHVGGGRQQPAARKPAAVQPKARAAKMPGKPAAKPAATKPAAAKTAVAKAAGTPVAKRAAKPAAKPSTKRAARPATKRAARPAGKKSATSSRKKTP